MELQELKRRNVVEVIREALTEIAAAHPEGLLTAADVVDAARAASHPLHGFFDWSDESAAEQWRLFQARGLIRRVRVVPVNGADGVRSVPKFVSLMHDRQREGGGYRQTNDVIADDELRRQLEETAKHELQGWLDRHAALTELIQKVAAAAGIDVPKKRRRSNR